MDFKKALAEAQTQEEFKEWKKNNPESYLAHGFIELNDAYLQASPWSIGYYNPDSDRIVTIKCEDSFIEISGEEEIFKKPDAKVEELKPQNVRIELQTAITALKECKEKEYKKEVPSKTIVILQKVPEATIWNFTILTEQMSTVNVWVDAATAKIIKHKLISIMDFHEKDEE